jgi:SNF2 family DNA or RNA helicase
VSAAALLMDMGVGKSLTSIAIAGRLYLDGKASRVLIFAPASVLPVWEVEFAKFADFNYRLVVLNSSSVKCVKQLAALEASEAMQVVVVNYEKSWRLEKELLAWKPELVVLDEMQRIKSPGAKQSKSICRICASAKYKIGATGTPVSQSPLDIYGQYKALDPSIFGSSVTAFKAKYAHEVALAGGGKMVVGIRQDALPDLTKKTHSIAYRVSKEECLDLPDTVDVERYCELDAAGRTAYNDLAKDSITQLSAGEIVVAQNVLTRILRLQQLTGGHAKDDTGKVHKVHNTKLALLEEVIDEAPGKVVVFAKFTAEIDAIQALLNAKKIGPHCKIDGRTPMNERGMIVDVFQNAKNVKVFVAQTRAAGLGITLTAADTAVFYSPDFSVADYDQARGRLHRIGQQNKVTYIHLIARNTVDEKILESLRDKRDLSTTIVDHWREVINYGI